MTLRIYISVPMAGQPDNGMQQARMIEDVVRAMGGEPVVPHDIPAYVHDGGCPPGYATNGGHSSACWLRGDLIEMLKCDAILLGHGWQHSVGCRLEMNVAAHCGIEILFFDNETAEISDTENNVIIKL